MKCRVCGQDLSPILELQLKLKASMALSESTPRPSQIQEPACGYRVTRGQGPVGEWSACDYIGPKPYRDQIVEHGACDAACPGYSRETPEVTRR